MAEPLTRIPNEIDECMVCGRVPRTVLVAESPLRIFCSKACARKAQPVEPPSSCCVCGAGPVIRDQPEASVFDSTCKACGVHLTTTRIR